MLLHFIRRDPAWRFTPWFTLSVALAALINNPGHERSLLVAMAGPVFVVLFSWSAPHRRTTLFEAGLPVPGRTLFLARLLAILSLIWPPAIAAGTVLLAVGSGAQQIEQLLLVAMMLTLAVVAILSVRIKEFAAPPWLALAAPAATGMLAAAAVMLGHTVLLIAAFAVVTLVLGARTWNAVPEAFQSPVSRRSTRTGNAAPGLPWWPVWMSVSSWNILLFVGISLSFVTTGNWVLSPLYLMIAYSQMRIASRWVTALPLSRHALLAICVLPMLVVFGIGAEVGMVTGMAKVSRDLVRQGDPKHFRATGALDVFVSPAFWRLAPGGRAPEIRAPWGEMTQPPPIKLGLTFYNPYSVAQNNSLQFQDWQFERATTEVYGRPISARNLALAKVKPRPITMQPRMQILSLALILGIALFWIWLGELAQWHRLARLRKAWRTAVTSLFVFLIAGSALALDVLVDAAPGSISVGMLQTGLLWVSGQLPDSLWLVGLVSLIPLAVMWWVVDCQAGLAEINQAAQAAQTMFSRLR